MTREEAIKWMEETIQDAEGLLDKCSPALKEEVLEQNEVFKIAITALRSVSREQVEKAWKGNWKFEPDVYDSATYVCSKCGEPWTLIDGTPVENNMNFCPNCGAALTDEAVQMVMKRLEEIL